MHQTSNSLISMQSSNYAKKVKKKPGICRESLGTVHLCSKKTWTKLCVIITPGAQPVTGVHTPTTNRKIRDFEFGTWNTFLHVSTAVPDQGLVAPKCYYYSTLVLFSVLCAIASSNNNSTQSPPHIAIALNHSTMVVSDQCYST